MHITIEQALLYVVFAPLVGSVVAGLLGRTIGRSGAHSVTIAGMLVSFAGALFLAKAFFVMTQVPYEINLYTWAIGGKTTFYVGFLLDRLSVLMMLTVTFVSLLVHIYSIGYMHDDPGYARFFSYISLFTFAMLMLVGANNFMQLFFGWEGVGLVSYLLIGFWYKKESALQGSLKAFVVNRVGDFGFLLGIAAVLQYAGDMNYQHVFAQVSILGPQTVSWWPGQSCSVITLICVLLFIGAMGKSAQVPLHVWLPESMEGPTPISALIHAATMVTAGIYMVSRLSPLFELSTTALNLMLVVGATGALFMGLLGLVQHDIKRVVAYSTLSQLGYMIAALGASAYAAGMFHLFTHACFKALLFLGAGSVIIALHHEQDMRKMGGLWHRMPVTYITMVIGSLALCGIPPFAGFYSKDTIIEAIAISQRSAAGYAYVCVLLGVFVTSLYTFRALFLTFHGRPRMDSERYAHAHESPWVVWLPLVILAVPSAFMGWYCIGDLLYGLPGVLGQSIAVLPQHDVLAHLGAEFGGAHHMVVQAWHHAPIYLALAGIFASWLAYHRIPQLPGRCASALRPLYVILRAHYGFDAFNQWFFVRGVRGLARLLSEWGDQRCIDAGMVNGSGRVVYWWARGLRVLQSGLLQHYTLAMVLGLFGFLVWVVLVAQ